MSSSRRLSSIGSLWLLLAARTVASQLPFEAVEPHMGTLFRIKLYAASSDEARAAFARAFQRVAELDRMLSDYSPESELNRLCAAGAAETHPVSAELFFVLEKALAISAETNGRFDVTIGPLTHLWRESRKKQHMPSEDAISQARLRSGYEKLHLNSEARRVKLDMTGMQLDLGGIAKGYAADEALRALSGVGVKSALVAASGDLAFSDAPPGEDGWKVGIDSLDQAGAPFTRVLVLMNAAVSTSGDTEQHLDFGMQRFSHVIDPSTGLGLTSGLTVTVVAKRGIDADAYATALSVMGCADGLRFADGPGAIAALFVTKDRGAGRLVQSKQFRELKVSGVLN